MHTHVNIFKIYTVCVYLHIHIHNKYTQYTDIYYVNNNFVFCMRLIVIKLNYFYLYIFTFSWHVYY